MRVLQQLIAFIYTGEFGGRGKEEVAALAEFLQLKVDLQEKEKARSAAAVERNKLKVQEHENKIRGSLLEAFSKEDQERLVRNAQKRLGAEREKTQQ